MRVSIHARTGRATGQVHTTSDLRGFQFTRARGARHASSSVGLDLAWFQFTRARGARLPSSICLRWFPVFQFTRARGARLGAGCCTDDDWLFQFTRARGARRCAPAYAAEVAVVSIHARTGRATSSPFNTYTYTTFQFTRARGARLQLFLILCFSCSFNSRAHGARDVQAQVAASRRHRFNSRAHGARDTCRR